MEIKVKGFLTNRYASVISESTDHSFFNEGDIPLILLDMVVIY